MDSASGRSRDLAVLAWRVGRDVSDAEASGAAATEAAVRGRWHERRLRGRPAPPRDTTASTFAVHVAPPVGGATQDGGAAAMVAADVVARHAAMEGARVEHVAARPSSPTVDELEDRLACDDDEVARCDVVRPSYVDSAWWAVEQLWHAGVLRERSDAETTCEGCASRDAPAPSAAGHALVRFPVIGDGALRTVGASLLVAADAMTLPDATKIVLAPDVDRVLAQAVGDAYPVVVARAGVRSVLGDDADVHRDVAVEELLAATCRHPLDDSGPVTVVPATRPEGRTAVGARPASATTEGSAGRNVGGEQTPADRAAALLAALRERGLLLGVEPGGDAAPACAACGGSPEVAASWVVATSASRDQLHEEHGRVARWATGAVAPWALGDEDWTVSGPAGSGVPLPLWRCDRCDAVTAVPGRAELAALTGRRLDDADHSDDAVTAATFACGTCGDGTARRVSATLDPLFVAAVMPFARFGFPAVAGSDGRFARRHHADVMIAAPTAAAADATLTVATLLWGTGGHDVVLGTPRAAAAATDVMQLCDRHGGDAVRWALLSPVACRDGDDLDGLANAASRDVVAPLRDACALLQAAAVDAGLVSADAVRAPAVAARDAWDRWLLAELAATVDTVRSRLAAGDPGSVVPEVRGALGWLQSWMSHRTAGGVAAAFDAAAIATAHEYLITLAASLAPYMPFVADEVYETLVRQGDARAPDSVHLLRFPTADPRARDDDLRDRMRARLAGEHTQNGAGPPATASAGAHGAATALGRPAVRGRLHADVTRRPAPVR